MIKLTRFWQTRLLATLIGMVTAHSNAETATAMQLEPIPAERAATIATVLDELLDAVDRSQFDLEARLDSLDFDENEIISFVVSEIAYRVETGRVAPANFLDRSLRTQRAVLDSLASDTPLSMGKGLIAQFSEDAEVFLLTSDAVAAQNEAVVSYRVDPTIVARYFPYGRMDAGLEGFDIMNAPRYAVSRSDNRPDPNATMFSGIVDTWVEHELFAGTDWTRSAYGRLQQRSKEGGTLTVLNSQEQPFFESLPVTARANVEKDLRHNKLVVLSGAPAACDAWWRVDPASGETLGMLSNGWGGSLTGYLRDLAAIHGKIKIASIATGCGLVVPFIAASAAISAAGLFQLDEALRMQGMDLCSQMPPNLQALCTATATAWRRQRALASQDWAQACSCESV